jgi:hypothetical protein
VVLRRRSVSPVSTFRMASWRGLIAGMVYRPHTSLACQYGYQKLGRVGQKNRKIILGIFRCCMRRPTLRNAKLLRSSLSVIRLGCHLVPALIVLGCGHKDLAEPLQSGKVLAWSGLQGRWVGPVVPSEPSCGRETQGLLSIGESDFGFDPFQSTTVIDGKVSEDGTLTGSLVRESPDHKPLSISFQAATSGSDAIKGQLQSGRCHWTVMLHRG